MTANHDFVHELTTAVAKATPPITVYALTLNEWVAVATIFYIVLQSGFLLWKWWNEFHRKRAIDVAMRGRVANYAEKAPK